MVRIHHDPPLQGLTPVIHSHQPRPRLCLRCGGQYCLGRFESITTHHLPAARSNAIGYLLSQPRARHGYRRGGWFCLGRAERSLPIPASLRIRWANPKRRCQQVVCFARRIQHGPRWLFLVRGLAATRLRRLQSGCRARAWTVTGVMDLATSDGFGQLLPAKVGHIEGRPKASLVTCEGICLMGSMPAELACLLRN